MLVGLGFLGLSYLLIYIGAITVLFLFVVMMLNLQLAELNAMASEYTQNLPLGAMFVFLLFIELYPFSSNAEYQYLNPFKIFPDIEVGLLNTLNSIMESLGYSAVSQSTNIYLAFNSSPDVNFSNILDVQSIGFTLYTYTSVWLFVASLTLLLAMIGPIVLTLKTRSTV